MPRTTTLHAVTAIGIDMGKNTLHLIGLDARGAIRLREKVARGRIALRPANLPPCLIGIEAGMATHYVARELAALGHDVKQFRPRMQSRFGRGKRMTSEMLMPWPRLCSGRRPASFPPKPTSNWICRRCIGCGLASSASEPR